MKTKENICEKKDQTEGIVETTANVQNGDRKGLQSASAVLGKFKDADALARAYGALEAEFTRRSQRLRELERKAENSERAVITETSGAEKLRKNAETRRAEAKKFDEFLTEIGQSAESGFLEKTQAEPAEGSEEPFDREGGSETKQEEASERTLPEKEGADLEENVFPTEREQAAADDGQAAAETKEKTDTFVAEEKERTAEKLYRQVCQNEEVRLKIIGEYIASIGKTGAPLTTAGVGYPIAPPLKARTIGDAGNMALRYFKNGVREK